MIVEYLRPHSIEEALLLLSRSSPLTVPLGGGVSLSRKGEESNAVAVVDLQELGLNTIEKTEGTLKMGATATLQEMVENPALPQALRDAVRLEMNFNLRQMATIGGLAACADGLSPTAVVLVGLAASLKLEPGGEMMALEDYMAKINGVRKLITEIHVTRDPNCQFLSIGRTRYDTPLACAVRCPAEGRCVISSEKGKSPMILSESILDGILLSSYSQQIPPNNIPHLTEMTKTLVRRLFTADCA